MRLSCTDTEIRGFKDFGGHEFDLLGSCDVIGHVTIGLGICGFLLVVHWNYASILHRYGDIGPQRYWGHDPDLLGSRDVIGHVTIGLGVGTFLLVVNDDHASILHRYGDTGLQRFWGHEFDLFGVTWRYRSRDHWTQHMWFPIDGPLEPCVYLAPLWRYWAPKMHLPML